jgi:hypothetical protein
MRRWTGIVQREQSALDFTGGRYAIEWFMQRLSPARKQILQRLGNFRFINARRCPAWKSIGDVGHSRDLGYNYKHCPKPGPAQSPCRAGPANPAHHYNALVADPAMRTTLRGLDMAGADGQHGSLKT